MRNKSLLLRGLIVSITGFLLAFPVHAVAVQRDKSPTQLRSPATRDERQMETLKEKIRHQLVTLPYYSVFDWLEGRVKPDGTVELMGEVTRPTLKDDALGRVKKLETVRKVVDNIEVLPLSPIDDELRGALYRAIFRFNSPLFRYGTQAVPSIHIIVKNGHATLKGVVQNQADSQIAYMAASGVSGLFEVKNELQIEQSVDEKVSKK